MTQQRKVIHVELKEPYKGKHHWYFGSIAAIYDTLTVEMVGITQASLWNVLSKTGKHVTRCSTIRVGVLRSRLTNRGRKGVLK